MTAAKDAYTAGKARFRYPLVFLLIVGLIGAAAYSYFLYHKRILVAEKYKELSAIADLKADQISQWRRDYLNDAHAILTNPLVFRRIVDYLDGRDKAITADEFRAWMKGLHESGDFIKCAIIRPNGEAICSFPAAPVSQDTRTRMSQAISQQQAMLSDFHRDTPSGYTHLELIIPIMDPHGRRPGCAAVIALEIDPQKFMYPLIQSWPSPSASAETVLVEREGDNVLFLNELRHRKNTALVLRRPLTEKKLVAVRAALGQEGIFEGVDYRGVPVLAAIRTIKDSPWAILAKVDSAEVFNPIYKRASAMASLSFMTALAAGLLIYLWWMRKKESYLQRQYETELQHNAELKQAELALHLAHFELEKRVIERTSELTHANARLRAEMSERKQLQLKLIEAKQLETIGQLAGGVAHEVRNPLNAILTITEALFREKEIEVNQEFKPYIQHIRSQVNRLAHLMSDLLELGKPIPTASLLPVSLPRLCQDTVALWQSTGLSANRQVELDCLLDGDSLLVLADEMKLQQVVFNLLENAGHHNPLSKAIQVQILSGGAEESSRDMALVRIVDQGPGIPAEKLSRVFEPFYSNRKGGTGLGLTLVKHFTEHMGGTVTIRNNEPLPGCTAEVWMPLMQEASL